MGRERCGTARASSLKVTPLKASLVTLGPGLGGPRPSGGSVRQAALHLTDGLGAVPGILLLKRNKDLLLLHLILLHIACYNYSI